MSTTYILKGTVMTHTRSVLETLDLVKHFGGITAVDHVSLSIRKGEIVGLVGRNGSGKTVLFNLISQFIFADEGQVFLNGINITGKKPWEVARMGLMRSFQEIRIFKGLSTLENLLLAMAEPKQERLLSSIFNSRLSAKEKSGDIQKAYNLLERFGLAKTSCKLSGHLSRGQQQLLGVVCSIATGGNISLFDEPTAGLSEKSVHVFEKEIIQLKRQGNGILIIEHDMNLIRRICDQIVVISKGAVFAVGKPVDVLSRPEIEMELLR